MSQVRVESVTSPAPTAEWQSIWDMDPDALPSLSPVWRNAVVASAGHADISRLYRFSDGARAVLPLFARSGVLKTILPVASPPAAWGFGGLISDRPMTADHVAAVREDLEKLSAIQISIRPNPIHDGLWAAGATKGWTAVKRCAHMLDLSPGFEQIRTKGFSSNARRHLKNAEKSGLVVESGHDPQIISAFHGLLVQSFDRWADQQGEPSFLARWRGLARDPEQKFQAIAATIGPMFKIFLARLDGRPAAAILVLYGHHAHYTRGAMNKELAAPTAANYLLHAKAIEEACALGCRHYQMGETGSSRSLADFKEKFGARPVDYHEYRHEKFPVTKVDTMLRTAVKRMIGMKDA